MLGIAVHLFFTRLNAADEGVGHFVYGIHTADNALIFFNDGGETFNKGAEFMGTNPIIRTMEVVLFIGIIAHIVDALILTMANNKTRTQGYVVNNGNANSKWYSRWMGLLGTLILMFLIIHLSHFWVISRFTDIITGGQKTLFQEMQDVFQNSIVVVVYMAAMVSLAYHLLHGFQSAFQTMGLNNKKYTPAIKSIGVWFSIVISIVFASMPLAIHMGWVK